MVIYVTFLKLDFYWLSVSVFQRKPRTGSSRRPHSSTRPNSLIDSESDEDLYMELQRRMELPMLSTGS